MYIENNITKKQLSFWLVFMFWIISSIIVVGGLTRLTDSGLSITQWELFSGFLPPLNDQKWIDYFDQYKQIPEFKLQNYSMTLGEFKVIFWWEWVHRFLGRLIGIAFLIPLIFFTIKLGFKKLINHYFIFFLICFQGFIGWYMVASGLVDKIDVSHFRLSIHLVMAFFILSLILWNYFKLNINNTNLPKLNNLFPYFFLILVFLQITIGAFVSGMDAGKIYNSWPLMGSSYFPDDSQIINLFKLSVFSDPSLVQFLHRNLAYFILIFYLLISFKVYKQHLNSSFFAVNILGFFLLLQIILGIFTVINGAQILLSSMHQISSIFLVTASTYFLYINK
jgi:cytochrome c oxidase assembly protein subunit 15|tara:strand:+ start:2743 stop:3750 length:1008 start_codon:yes stop_codon:yes gene_type:complete